jgi:hypothetical protein
MATKTGYLKDSIAKATGYYSAKGEKLKGAALTQEEQDSWNGVVKKAAEPVVEVQEEVEHIKKSKKKKGLFSKGS